MSSLLLMTKLLAASSIVYLTFRWWIHHPNQQRRAIKRMFRANTEIHIDRSVPKLERAAEENFLRRWFDSPPNGLIVLAGPVGAGRSYLIKSVLSDRKMTIYVDFRREPVVTGEEYIANVVAAAGYIIPQATEIMRMFTREEQRKTKITAQEADRALAVILQALQECKANKWPNGIPLICLDDVNVTGQVGPNGVMQLDPFWTKFLDWCAYISDAKLAHVVFVPAQSYEPHNVLYDHPTFRTKRVLLFVDYPSMEKVGRYVRNFVTERCPNSYPSPQHLDHMVGWIANCLGGQLDDLMHVLVNLQRGDKYGAVLRRMITDAVSSVEERLEQVLAEAHNPTACKEDVYKKYIRLWSAMEMLRDHEVVNRRDIVRHIFKQHTAELKQYVEWGLFAYANQKAEIDDGDQDNASEMASHTPNATLSLPGSSSSSSSSSSTSSSTHTTMTTSSAGGTAATSAHAADSNRMSPYPAWWKSDTTSTKATESASAGSGTGIHSPATTNPSATPGSSTPSSPTPSATPPPSTHTHASSTSPAASPAPSPSSPHNTPATMSTSAQGTTPIVSKRTHSTLLNASLESMLVAAGSPRLRIAFDLLLKDDRLSDRKKAMTIHLDIKSLQDQMDKIEVVRKQRLEELQVVLAEMNRLLSLLSVWKEEFGAEFVESRKTRLMRQETEIYQHMDALHQDSERLLKKKTECEASLKLLRVKL